MCFMCLVQSDMAGLKEVERMSEYKCTVSLEQYTPMLHFQWREDGACLRASEVKPKLDRYVIQYLARRGFQPQDLPADWSDYDKDNPKTHVALRYKMRFSATEKKVSSIAHPLYFGDMGSNRGRIKEVCFEQLSMSLICLSENRIELPEPNGEVTLMDILKSLLPAFFATHCFGTRSNKGFGSLRVTSIEGDKCNEKCNLAGLLPPNCEKAFYMTYKKTCTSGYSMLDNIYVISSLMKGGVQGRFKSQIHQFAHRENTGSEKDYIKSRIIWRVTHTEDAGDIGFEKYAFYRALLGLTENYTFPNIGRKVWVNCADKEIKRFPNPVVFKPDENGILVMVYSVPWKLRTAPFTFGGTRGTIKPPQNFDLIGFIRECLGAYISPDRAASWNDWDNAKNAQILRRNTPYRSCMNTFKEIIEIPKNAEEGE